MSVVRLTEQERSAILATRPAYGGERTKSQKDANIRIFKSIKDKYGIPSNKMLKVEIDKSSNPDYLVLKDKETGRPFEDIYGRSPKPVPAFAAPAELPKAARPSPASEWPFPDSPGAQHSTIYEKMAATDKIKLDVVAPQSGRMGAGYTPRASGPELKVGSISLDDARDLLRAEGDMCTSFATSTDVPQGNVYVKDGRLFFVI